MTDLLVLGSGVAGLSAALHARAAGRSVLVLTKGELSHSATWYAQGGVAAALGEPDSPALHFRDTVVAGAGLCDEAAVDVLVREGPDRVRELAEIGARFDDDDGTWLLAREGGHSLARVVHAGGDATGAEIERALVAATLASGCEIREGWFALALLVVDGQAAGVVALDPAGNPVEVRATDTVIATGGAGQCYAVTTNPALSTGDGIALALRARVACADMEFVQFHPTALHHPAMPRPLLSEALRGEGALLRDASGDAFMRGEHPLADLAPRRRRPGDPRPHARRGFRSPLARCHDDRRLRRPLPDDLERVPDRRSRSDARMAPGRARRALPLGRGLRRPRRRHHHAGPLGLR